MSKTIFFRPIKIQQCINACQNYRQQAFMVFFNTYEKKNIGLSECMRFLSFGFLLLGWYRNGWKIARAWK